MQNVAPDSPYFPASVSIAGRVSVWNRRLLIGAIVLVLWPRPCWHCRRRDQMPAPCSRARAC